MSAQTKKGVKPEEVRRIVKSEVIIPLLGNTFGGIEILVNPIGVFYRGGPYADRGLTGRKLMVVSYGGIAHHGGGAFSGKDCTKVDRSGAYYARYVAKSIVKAGLADKCEVGVSYSIGVSNPISVSIDTFGTGKIGDDELLKLVDDHFDFSVGNIIKELKLKDISYQRLPNMATLVTTSIPGSMWMEKQRNSRRLQPKRLHNFYKSDALHKVREEVILRAKGRCEVCGKPGTEVHHKIHLTLDNVDDPSIALNLDNLLLLCKECHNKMHGRFNGKLPKYKWNDDGDLIEVREEENR